MPVAEADSYQIFAAEHSFDFAAPDLSDLTVEECATSLGRLVRWRGAIPISVGQHSVALARYAQERRGDGELARWLLLHDVPEILLGDLPSPLKSMKALEPYRLAEARVMDAVVERFGLSNPEPLGVRAYDVRIRRDEVEQHLPHAITAVRGLRRLGVVLDPWTPARARREFIAEAKNLGVE